MRYTRSFIESAAINGVHFEFEKQVTSIKATDFGYELKTSEGEIYQTKAVVNAAGLYADEMHKQNVSCRFFTGGVLFLYSFLTAYSDIYLFTNILQVLAF